MIENWQRAGFGIYVHWPYCEAKCPYCDFNVHVSRRVDHGRWRAAFERDLDAWAERLPSRVVSSVFFGGGTPSLMPPDLVAAVLDRVARNWPVANDVEISLEANPTSAEMQRFVEFRQAGIGRFSIGVQALRDEALIRLGRRHGVREAWQAVDAARATGARVSMDLIYGRQGQGLGDWEEELGEALRDGPEHLSLYQLTIEPDTPFARRLDRGRLPGLPGDDLAARMFERTGDLCRDAGKPRYEVSNYASPESVSRHNTIYWRAGDWIGVGPGAFGRFGLGDGRIGVGAVRDPEEWLTCVEAGHPKIESEDVTAENHCEEMLFSGLRLTGGLDLEELRSLGYRPSDEALKRCVADGLLILNGGTLHATSAGLLLLDSVVRELVPLEALRQQPA
jgi:oxygen-independent coproporphyrinogen-3 oxidase